MVQFSGRLGLFLCFWTVFENWFSGRVSLVLYFSLGVGLGSGADTGRGVAGYSGNGVEGE